jgi:hypothetical protein
MRLFLQQQRYRRGWTMIARLGGGALLIVSALTAGAATHARVSAVMDSASGFSHWTWLPGDRAVWISRRPACIAETTTKACEGGHGTGVRLVYYGPEVRRIEVALPLTTR